MFLLASTKNWLEVKIVKWGHRHNGQFLLTHLKDLESPFFSQMLNVWYIYQHLGSLGGPNVGKYTIHWVSGYNMLILFVPENTELFWTAFGSELHICFLLNLLWFVFTYLLGCFGYVLSINMGVSKNIGTPKIIHFNSVFHYFHYVLPIFLGWHPYGKLQYFLSDFSIDAFGTLGHRRFFVEVYHFSQRPTEWFQVPCFFSWFLLRGC